MNILADIIQFFIILLPVITSYVLASFLFGKTSIIDKLNTVFLFLCCQVILITETLSLVNQINGTNFLVMAIGLFFLSLFMGKNIKESVLFDFGEIKSCKIRLYQYAHQDKWFALFLAVLLFSFLWRMFLIIYVPPNNWDSMTYHLSKVAYWMQDQSLHHFFTFFSPQVAHPFNGEILDLWTMVASRSDCFCGFIQFICYLLSGTLVYQCLRRYLNIEAIPSLIVMFVWYSLPEVVLESTSTQNDLIVAYFVMFSLTYFLLGIAKQVKYLVLSALALGVAIGVKTTAVFFIGPFVISILILSVRGAVPIQRLILWGSIVLGSFAALGSYNFIQDYIEFHNVLGSPNDITTSKISAPTFKSFISNFSEHLFNMATNQSGLNLCFKPLANAYNALSGKIGAMLFRLCHIPTNVPGAFRGGSFSFTDVNNKFNFFEDYSFFGTVGMIMIVLTIYMFFIGARRLLIKNTVTDIRYLLFALLFIGYLSMQSYTLNWDPWASRYMITAVLTGMPLLALIFNSKTPLIKKMAPIIILYCILVLIAATMMDRRKPLNHLRQDRIGLRCLGRPEMEPIFRKFESLVPLNTRVGTLLAQDCWDYPLFGERLKRTIVPLNAQVIQAQKFDFLVIIDTVMEQNKRLKELILKNYSQAAIIGKVNADEWELYKPNKI